MIPIILNDNGTQNSCSAPAQPGSVISFFVNGVGEGGPDLTSNIAVDPHGMNFDVVMGSWSAEVVNAARENDYVWRVDVRLPAAITSSSYSVSFTMREGSLPVGPL